METYMTAIDATDEVALAAWKNGDPVWSCSMGGLGPGYEQCIQIIGFAMWEAMRDNPPADGWKSMSDDPQAWSDYRNTIEKTPEVAEAIAKLNPSGAQFGAAVNLASVFTQNGYAKGMKMVPGERKIQVQRDFPTL